MNTFTPDARARAAEDLLRDRFVAWQCRLRQHAVRELGGRPTPGMRPQVLRADGGELMASITVVLIEADPGPSTALFRHIFKRTHDPEKRYRDALSELSGDYFEDPKRFSDVLTALFPAAAASADRLVASDDCVLAFDQLGESFRLPCAVTDLAPDDPTFQATYWHNAMFNPAMPSAPRVLAFAPDWRRLAADSTG